MPKKLRKDIGPESVVLLAEILSRIELPPFNAIPDADEMEKKERWGLNRKIVIIVSIISAFLFATFFVKFFPPLDKASIAVITKESKQTAVKTTHKRGAGIGRFSRMNHVVFVNNKDWIVLGPWTKDQSEWTTVQTALYNGETVEIVYAAQSNLILDHIPVVSWFSDFPILVGKVKAQVWSSKTKQWHPQLLNLQTILQARHNSGEVFYDLEARNSWINFLPLVFIALILFLNIKKRKSSRTIESRWT